jgi:hypothetical protein
MEWESYWRNNQSLPAHEDPSSEMERYETAIGPFGGNVTKCGSSI